MHILVQHEVEDFEVWKKVYDEDEPARAAAGFKEITLYQGLDNPNNVVAIFSNDVSGKRRDGGRPGTAVDPSDDRPTATPACHPPR